MKKLGLKELLNTRGKKIAACLCAGVLLLGGAGAGIGRWAYLRSIPPSSQSDYPVLPEYDLFSSEPVTDLERLSTYSDLVVVATVDEVYPPQTVTYTPPKDSNEAVILEKQGIQNISSDKTRVDVKVNQVLRGRESRKVISVWRHTEYEYLDPDLKKGDTMILFLYHSALMEGDYVMTSSQSGYYYLAADNKVYPARVTEALKETSGMSLGEFKRQVKNAKMKEILPEDTG